MKSLKEILCSLEGLSDIELFVIDLFCGAGGLSEGVEEARLNGNRCAKVVCCVNHDKNAILSHDANIPDALHFIEDIRTLELSPINTIVERIRELYPDSMIMLHASLECTNFSKAKGGQPRDADSRTLAEHLFRYIDVIAPDYIQIENVEEFMSWGDMDENGKPISMDKGRLYQKWVRNVKKYGYNFEHRILNAADFGAYTTRKRFFGIFAKKSLPIVFPEPTHCKGGRQDMFSRLEKWKPVKDVLDFSDEGTTIFREKPLAEKTLERIYNGLIKFVAGGKDAFLVKYNSMNRTGKYNAPGIDEPCPVVTTQNRLGVAQVCFLSKQFSGHPESKNVSVEEPAGTITCRDHHAFVSAHYGNGFNRSVNEPSATVTTKDRLSLVTPRFIANEYSGGGQHTSIDNICPAILTNPKQKLITCKPWIMNTSFSNIGSNIEEPAQTITANRKWHYLMNPQFNSAGGSVDNPCFTLIARMDKMPPYLVATESGQIAIEIYDNDSPMTVKIKEFMALYGIVDIKMRMLRIPELKRIMGFPEDYVLVGTQADQKKFIGNAVEVTQAKKNAEALCAKLRDLRLKKLKEVA
ncbi:DNA cytosine methyltransferase [Bacteroides uniformis]|uniref:DNA (cytosine-5-)-methyltransferase n=1 Tax=Bacteroides uniformis TaxID=820 RepID=A0AAW6GPD2_BACUN|nr:DNA cytosine methyltransferase [Bacteroides uniformis]MDC1831658.1 DNA cytosine methyltransferase [Bacteroides uniformis]MDC1880577.1 DNA cytosine methyltransferase [Bacteroides uniformis]MDC1885064.1 DNA cytosine methyltransferase [Bacteroides uniformis]RHE34305.1 DNA cytosine methyltransferase [Bacteroides uniformis]